MTRPRPFKKALTAAEFDSFLLNHGAASWPRTAVLFDLHFPNHDPAFWGATLAFLTWLKPDCLVLDGDAVDNAAFNPHKKGKAAVKRGAVQAQIEAVRPYFLALRQAVGPECRIIYLKGNHEDWTEKWVHEEAPELEGLECVTLPALLGLSAADLKIEWVGDKRGEQPIRLGEGVGSVKILHGHNFKGGGQFPAKKLVEVYGESGVTILCGHFHRDQVFVKEMDPHPTTGMVVGCGRDLDPDWYGEPKTWGHRLAVIDQLPGRRAKVTVLNGDDGAIVYGARVFYGPRERA